MRVLATGGPLADLEVDALVLGIWQDEPLAAEVMQLDTATGGALTRLLESGEFVGKPSELSTLLVPAGLQTGQLVVLGLGPRTGCDRRVVSQATGSAARHLAGKARARVAYALGNALSPELLADAICGALTGCVGQDVLRSKPRLHSPGEVLWWGVDEGAVQPGVILADSVNFTRRLVNLPAGEIYPESFVEQVKAIAPDAGLDVEVWDQQRLAEERCGSLLGVAQGSDRPARLMILHHRGGAVDAPTLALVGKGVTFDSGGLSLKSSEGMKAMKCDMAGAATVAGAMQAIGRSGVAANVIGLVGLVENMVSGRSYKLGDVLTARNGKTIEVLNTDAEGRLVLADVLDVAVERGADKIIDLATLTGACVVALGMDVGGLMSNQPDWCDQVASAAARCGERAWPLPMFPEFAEQIKSQVADIKNIGDGRWGGAITAAKFLEEFVSDQPWVHIDIAGPAFREKPKPWMDGGASGAFVRTLLEIAVNWGER
ncbi:MAG: leucyl aminopeptidase [Planctomycetota bacterium]|nr:leucyl aminopeptidase [Planctomycetota bacterium]